MGPLEDQEPDATGPDPSPALVHVHAPAHPHQPTSDAEGQEGTLLALVIATVTLSAAGRTVVVVHLDATFIDQIVLVPAPAPLFAAITQRDLHHLEDALRATPAVGMDVAGPEVIPFALAVPAPDRSHVRVRVLCPTQATLDTVEAGAVQGLSVGEGGVEAAMILGIVGRDRPGLSFQGCSTNQYQTCFIFFLLLNLYLFDVTFSSRWLSGYDGTTIMLSSMVIQKWGTCNLVTGNRVIICHKWPEEKDEKRPRSKIWISTYG